jgi:predicted RNase H-like nuclease (RuvC/YqgF family)
MRKRLTAIEKAIAKLEDEIRTRQAAIAALREQLPTTPTARDVTVFGDAAHLVDAKK